MRSAIWEYLTPSIEQKEELWNNCVFVFDTNVLLNLYRYSSNTRDTLLSALEDLKERVWLPHQVAYEFAKNRFDVIFETVEKYNTLVKLEKDFLNRFATELRLKSTDTPIQLLNDSISSWIDDQLKKNLLVTQASDDSILEKLLFLFEGKVGNAFSEKELLDIHSEGSERYTKQIPPGFCDAKKENDSSENNAYGDLVIWKQILTFASEKKKSVIYVTHDQKRDWWYISKGRTIGPRVELRKEFFEKTGKEFFMYSMEAFLEQYSKHKGQDADQSVIDEVNSIDIRAKRKPSKKRASSLYEYSTKLENNIVSIQERIARRQRAITSIQAKYHDRPMPPDVIVQLRNTEAKMIQLQQQLLTTQEKYDACQHRLSEYSLLC